MSTVISNRPSSETKYDQLTQIKKFTTIVADTADFEQVQAGDATTNPALVYAANQDTMATEKTAEGIRKFAADIAKLEKFVASKIK